MKFSFFFFLFVIFFVSNAYSEENTYINQYDIIKKNISTPEENLNLLAQLVNQKKSELISQLVTTHFIHSENFNELNSFVRKYDINLGHISEKRINKFAVDGEDEKFISVTFEHRPEGINGKWYVKNIVEINNGKSIPLAIEQNNLIYSDALAVFSEDNFFEDFTKLWKKKIKNYDYSLISLPDQQTVIENVIFYLHDNSHQNLLTQFAISTLTLVRTSPKPSKIENGWLIAGFTFKGIDLNREGDYFEPIYLGRYRNNQSSNEQQFESLQKTQNSNIEKEPKEEQIKDNRHAAGIIKNVKNKNKMENRKPSTSDPYSDLRP